MPSIIHYHRLDGFGPQVTASRATVSHRGPTWKFTDPHSLLHLSSSKQTHPSSRRRRWLVASPSFWANQQLHWSVSVLNEEPHEETLRCRRREKLKHSDTRQEQRAAAAVVVVGPRASVEHRTLTLCRRVDEVDAALLHVEGRTNGRGGRWVAAGLIWFDLVRFGSVRIG